MVLQCCQKDFSLNLLLSTTRILSSTKQGLAGVTLNKLPLGPLGLGCPLDFL